VSEESGGGRRAEASGTRREAVLHISHIEPWSVTRVAFALSCALAIVFVVATLVFWIVMKVTGVFGLLGDAMTGVLSDGSQQFSVGSFVGLVRLLVFTLILSAVNVVMMTALAAIGARLYNIVAELVGGVEVTFTDD
jgi:hypothetical protein